ncbi:MAG: hypothetical protein ACFFAU_14010 [Candidatus Hodarchaeota archaeon]
MILIWNLESILTGIILGIGLAIGFIFITEDLIASMREEDPNEAFINSEYFTILMKSVIPLSMVFVSGFILGPLFSGIHEQFILQENIFGLNPTFVYIFVILALSILLDVAVFVTKTPFPIVKLFLNTWTFITLGLLLHFLST